MLIKKKQQQLTFLFTLSPSAAMIAKYWITRFVLTVFPAPDSPLRTEERQTGSTRTVPPSDVSTAAVSVFVS